MSDHITREQLAHLAKLARLELNPEDEAKLLPQLEDILTFVGQLQEVDTSDVEQSTELYMSLREGIEQAGLTDKLLANVQHPIVDQAIQIETKLSEK